MVIICSSPPGVVPASLRAVMPGAVVIAGLMIRISVLVIASILITISGLISALSLLILLLSVLCKCCAECHQYNSNH